MKAWLWMLLALPAIGAQPLMNAPPNCIQPAKPGSCSAGITNHFYNTTSGQCETFVFGGCGGNDNRFQSKEDCERRCSCHMPPDTGPCRASMERWYYNEKKGCCERFTFGGCKPNGNNFESKKGCERTCNWSVPGKQKPLGIEWGTGYDRRLGEIVYKNYGTTYGGSGTIWLHNEIETMKSAPQAGSQIMGIIKRTGRRQVPGVQTKLQFKMMMGGGQGGGQGQGAGGMVSGGGLTSGGSGGMMSSGGGGGMMSSGGGGGMMSSGGSGGMMSSGRGGGMMTSGGGAGMMSSGGGGGMMASDGSAGMMGPGGGGGMMTSGGGGGMMGSGGRGGMMTSDGSAGMMGSGGGGGMMTSGGEGGMMGSGGRGGMMTSGGDGGMMTSGGGTGMMGSGGAGGWQNGGGQGAGFGPGIRNYQV
ncbi:keratin, type I cytoskeletal 9-like isoform X2 [Mizuhopecten yessoensis]|uniref:keratin, type I cytoskeletal 9-like isoform X2 n=1 Tax=Mizuhopecten yessoensis TaxID=6573 RepID=UPI000B45E76D|nr:keratin, type I cytoskeletal 9-like isoform X2 [Mizuhopecten yessoensis]